MDETGRILICLRYGIGDVVMEMPALRGLRRAWPSAHLTLLGAHPALELFEGDPDFQDRVCIHDFGFEHWGDRGKPTVTAAFQRWFTERHFALVLDPFHAVFGTHDILIGSGIPWRNSNPALSEPQHLQPGLGVQAIWENALSSWELDSTLREAAPPPEPYIPEQLRQAAQAEMSEAVFQGMTVGLAPVASSSLKCWPVEGMLELAEWLLHERQAQVLVFGLDAQQQELRRRFQALSESRLALVEPMHLQKTAALTQRCGAFVSNDTGLMHLAAAVGTPTIGVFGPTAAHLYLPPAARAVASDRPCDYRLHQQFGPPECVKLGRCLIAEESCIAELSTAAVAEAVDAMLDQAGPATSPSAAKQSLAGSRA